MPDTKPVQIYSPRSIPICLREQAKQEINKASELNVIRPVLYQLTGVFVWLEIGICVDLTLLNSGVQRELSVP